MPIETQVTLILLLMLTLWVLFLLRTTRGPGRVYRLEESADTRLLEVRRFLHRQTGLLNHLSLPSNEGLWLIRTRAIHTRGMRFAIDVVFLDESLKILGIVPAVPPGATLRGPLGTKSTIELAEGQARHLELYLGKIVKVSRIKNS